ncbi:DUF6418 domain-containing protein [Aquimarina sp. D1M17]|uniref:DUF6418 domain-containing protein n=1 Tax=Aquimarina acroporae TaxID=2937283 RepID=UPI0020BEFDBF|nr:DUF6418 domain-containing protein [Aquimarina acroporae]MCK8523324.1 DUF6418 domain-containing protein [Aquimarina acroporae]
MTLFFNIFLFAVFFLFLYLFAKKNFKLLFIYGLLVFQGISIIPSLIYIEEGIFISEQGRDSFFVGATLLYVLYFILTFLVILATFNTLNKFKTVTPRFSFKNKQVDDKIVLLIVIFSLLILLFNASQSRLPLFDSEVSRFEYWEYSKFPFLNKIFGNVSIFIPFSLGILYSRYKRSSIVLMIVYFGYNFLIGQKFSPIVSGLFSFLLPIVLTSNYKINWKKFLNKRILISVVLIFSLAYFVIYKRYEQRTPYAIVEIYDPNEAIFYRIFGLQGHLMWGATESYVYNDNEFSYDISDLSYGMHKLMYKFAYSQEGLEDSLESGFSFTNGYPSILFLIFPVWMALLLHVLLTIGILAFMGWLLKELVVHKAYVLSVIVYQLFNWTIYSFTMGYFYKLKFCVVFLVFYALVSFFYFRAKSLNKKKLIES